MKEKEEAEENKSEKMGKKVRRNLIHIEEDCTIAHSISLNIHGY